MDAAGELKCEDELDTPFQYSLQSLALQQSPYRARSTHAQQSPSDRQKAAEFTRISKEFRRLYDDGQLRKALPLAEELVEFSRQNLGDEALLTGRSIAVVGRLYLELHDYQSAKLHLSKAYAIVTKHVGKDGKGATQVKGWLDEVLAAMQPIPAVGDSVTVMVEGAALKSGSDIAGQVARGVELEVFAKSGPWLRVLAPGMTSQLWIHQNQVQKKGANTDIGRAPVPIASLMANPELNPNNPFLLRHLSRTASGALASGRGQELIRIEPQLQAQLNRLEDSGYVRTMRIQLLGIMSDTYRAQGDLEKTSEYMQRTLSLIRQTEQDIANGSLNDAKDIEPFLISMRSVFGWVQSLLGNHESGERLLAQATAETRRRFPDPDTAFTLADAAIDGGSLAQHGAVLLKLGRVAEARELLELALRFDVAYHRFAAANGRNASGTDGDTESLLAVCLAADGQADRAFETMNQSIRNLHRYATWPGHIADPNMEIRFREEPVELLGDHIHRAVSLGLQFGGSQEDRVSQTVSWVLNRKFKLADSIRSRIANIRETEGWNRFVRGSSMRPTAFGIGQNASLERIRELRGLAASYRIRSFAPSEESDARQEFETLRYSSNVMMAAKVSDPYPVPIGFSRDENGKAVAGRAMQVHQEMADASWIDVNAIQKKLTDGQVLMEFVRYRDFDYKALSEGKYVWRPTRYAAWIIPSSGDVVQLDVGPIDEVDAAIRVMRKAIQDAGKPGGAIRSEGEVKAVSYLSSSVDAVSELVLGKARPHLAGCKELIISPDGLLWLVPWVALNWSDKHMVIEQCLVRTVFTGREILSGAGFDKASQLKVGPPAVFADPDFDLRIKDADARNTDGPGLQPRPPSIRAARRGLSLIAPAARLPGTRVEAENIAPALEQLCGAEARIFLGKDAHEGALAATVRPRILVFGTHGFFLGNSEGGDRAVLPIRDPTMSAGLLLAGSNSFNDLDYLRADDGILTGYETSALDLRGTELVVLSACDTGLGSIKGGEGVVGLRQTFHVAGAESVVSSLWQIPDRDTAIIMVRFFENLAKGESKAVALRNAQLSRIMDRKERYGAAHPYFWAAFSLTGDAGVMSAPPLANDSIPLTVETTSPHAQSIQSALDDLETVDVRPGDWPMKGGWRGRNNTPRAARLPVEWDVDTGENIKWVAKLGSKTDFSDPVIANGKVIIGTNNGYDFKNGKSWGGRLQRYPPSVDLGVLLCFDEETGKFLWQYSAEKLPPGREHDWPHSGIESTPCCDGNRLWFVDNRGRVVCCDADGFRDGQNDGPFTDETHESPDEADVIWRFDMVRHLGVSIHNKTTSSPICIGERLFVVTGNGVDETHVDLPAPSAAAFVALDRNSGKLLWADNSPGANVLHGQWSSPTHINVDGQDQVLFGGGDGWLYSFDPAGDGEGQPKLLWKFDANPKDSKWTKGGRGTRNNLVASPVVWNSRVFLTVGQDPEHGEGAGHLWCIDPTKRGDISAEIVTDRAGTRVPHSREIAVNKQNGESVSANPNSGVIWHFDHTDRNENGKAEFEEAFHRTIACCTIQNGLVLATDFSGLLHCIDATSGRQLWTYDMFAACWSAPLIADGKVYTLDEDGDVAVFVLSPDPSKAMVNGEPHAEFNLGNAACGTPVVANGVLYVRTRRKLYAIQAGARWRPGDFR